MSLMTVVSFQHASIRRLALDDLMIFDASNLRCEQWIDANPAKVDADPFAIPRKKSRRFFLPVNRRLLTGH
jgi:hypothetical protein